MVNNILANLLIQSSPTGGMFPPAKFFPTSFLNIAENILRGRADSVVAIHFAREGVSGIEPVTWKAFREHIRAIRSAMVNSGVVKNDVVAAVISNSVDAMAICLAALSLGAVWSSSSCDLGTTGIIDRYRQISPKLVFADDGYTYAGKTIKLGDRIVDWSHRLDCDQTLKNVVLVPYCNVPVAFEEIHRGCTMQSFLQRDTGEQLDFKLVPFSHPAFILFSSGTVSSLANFELARAAI
jgi:acetoacetyl-CoA synthetase